MKISFTPVVMAMGLLAITNLAMTNTALAQGDPQAGQQKAALCVACHGEDGNSIAPQYPKLAGLGEKYLYKQLREIQNGDPAEGGRLVPEMAGMLAGFNDQDLQDLAAYYASQTMQLAGSQESEVHLNSGEDVDSLMLGENLYRFGNSVTDVPPCSGCHSPTGQGNAPAGYPRLGGQYADYIVTQLQAFRAGERVNDGEQQTMRDVAHHLTDAEIAAVANYIAGLH